MTSNRMPDREKAFSRSGNKIFVNHLGTIVAVAYWNAISIGRINNNTEEGDYYVRK